MGDALSLSLRVNTTRFEFTSENTAYSELGIRDPARRSIAATLTWTFGERSQRRQQQQQGQPQGGGDGGGDIGI